MAEEEESAVKRFARRLGIKPPDENAQDLEGN